MNSHPKNGTEKKINQRLFKRLILYYNVGVGVVRRRQNIHKSRQRSISPTDDSRLAVHQTTRARCVGVGVLRRPSLSA